VNIGDSYATGAGQGHIPGGGRQGHRWQRDAMSATWQPNRAKLPGLKPKDLCLIPQRLVIALQEEGWWVRSDIIWHKPNPMPESVQDRPTRSHEYLWLLTKGPRYSWNAAAVREDASYVLTPAYRGQPPWKADHTGLRTSPGKENGRNMRDVWTIATEPTPFAHFATMPTALVERCLRAGASREHVVLDPFAGACTTLLVAQRLGLDAIGIELNPAYLAMGKQRLQDDMSLLAQITEA
jgi:DNA modification methylase